jgi:xylulokinase
MSTENSIPPEGKHFLGIDIGTTNCKVAIGNREGKVVAAARSPCRLDYPREGWVEADPVRGWWDPLVEALNSLFKEPGAEAGFIRGICISCTNALVCLDGNGRPVRNALMQIDRRSAQEAEEIEGLLGGGEIFRITGNRAAPGTFSAPSIRWIMHSEPDTFGRVETILSPSGYIVQRLTGSLVMDRTRAATTLLYDISGDRWSESIRDTLKIPKRILPPILSPLSIAGTVSEEASRLTGLPPGIPVLAGVMDSVAAAVGMGVLRPGVAGIILGTVGRILWPVREMDHFDDRFLNAPLVRSDRWLSIACTNGTGLSVNWFARHLMGEEGRSSIEDALHHLDREAFASPAGSRGVIYLPFLAGERSPIWNPWAKGVFFGLDARHARTDLARSVLEGTAMSIRANMEILESATRTRPGTIRLSGGGAASPLWPQILSSVLGRELVIENDRNSECRGDIMLTAAATGNLSWEDIGGPSPQDCCVVQPVEREKGLYDRIFQEYNELCRDLRPRFRSSTGRRDTGFQGGDI